MACSDGAYDTGTSVASHGWVFASNTIEMIQATGAGPVDGYKNLISSCRAELSGIVAILYMIHRIYNYYNITTGGAKCYCDNKGALRTVFEKPTTGIKPYFTTDHDLVEIAQYLLTILPITVLHEWVKGHYTGSKKEYKHTLNHRADALATRYQR